MAKSGSLIAELGNETRGSDRKRAVKPKTTHRGHRVTHGEGSVTNHGQQHGELPSYKAPTSHQIMKASAKSSMRSATDDWVNGRITTKEHNAVHARGKHVLSGKHPREFKGTSGERKLRGLR
ncbi:MAG TPA: hypothetical protein VNZ53_19395 [Steroidobacteraceae bacterium]|nr:hypothetical protein [Steroidobacteraceae bacterium]